VVSFVIKVYLLNKLTDILYIEYWNDFFLPVLKVATVSVFMSYCIGLFVVNTIVVVMLVILSILLSVYYLDMSVSMRNKVVMYIANHISKLNKIK